ncbi:hypothetical protein DW132_06155 [Bifidobacterium longum]|nr:hypothetical protein DW135_05890 [Bifidobacterium longum]RHJ32402.1 hypothetical protein DW132_06155 [Bifidobacterium longum]
MTQTGHLLLGEQCLVLCSGLGEGLVGDAESAARGERLESGRAGVISRAFDRNKQLLDGVVAGGAGLVGRFRRTGGHCASRREPWPRRTPNSPTAASSTPVPAARRV